MTSEQEKAKELSVLLNAFAENKQFEWWNELDKKWCHFEVNFVSYLVENFEDGEKIRIKPGIDYDDMNELKWMIIENLCIEYSIKPRSSRICGKCSNYN